MLIFSCLHMWKFFSKKFPPGLTGLGIGLLFGPPPKGGTSETQMVEEVCSRTFGDFKLNSILSRQGYPILPSLKLEGGGRDSSRTQNWVFLCRKCRDAGSLTSTYRVVRKYNFKS